MEKARRCRSQSGLCQHQSQPEPRQPTANTKLILNTEFAKQTNQM